MTKEEKIKEAWENKNGSNKEVWARYWNYEKAKEHGMDENGWIKVCGYEYGKGTVCDYIRPPQLQGIEDYYSFIDVKGFESYQVNKQGVVVSKSRVSQQKNGKKYTVKEKIMKPQIDNTGYIVFGLRNNNKQTKKVYLHRILAECFIPNIENKPCVNHKDGVKYNNNLSNLEWCTYKENNIHAFDTGLQKKGKEHHFYGKRGIECHNHKNYQPIEKPLKPIY